MTAIRLVPGLDGKTRLGNTLADPVHKPGLLVSFVYLDEFLRIRHGFHYRDWVLDSGAFTADRSGSPINLTEFGDTALRLKASDPGLVEVFSLDVIGDWKASERNTRSLWKRGIEAIPTFHPGEPWSVLTGLAKDYPKIALGGTVGWSSAKKTAFVSECFARVWPKRVHGFGMASESLLMKFPFHSADASSWTTGPNKFGRWKAFGGKLSVKACRNFRAEVDWYLRLEHRLKLRWVNELKGLP